MKDGLKFEAMNLSKIWGPTNSIAWVKNGDGATPILCRAWQCRETGEIEWRALETVVLGIFDPPVIGEPNK